MSLKIEDISIALIFPSPTQPRQHFDEKKHEELTDSMREHGFTLSALLVRASGQGGGKFEIVTGERRFRAAKAAGLSVVPCIVRALNDLEVLEIQLIENLIRENLTPIEEAEHYKRLLALRGPANEPLHTLTTLARRIGNQTPESIRQRLMLCNLEGEAREAVGSGVLPFKTAYLIGRIVDPKARENFAQAVLHPSVRKNDPGETGPLSYREAAEIAETHYVKSLNHTPFSRADAKLYPVQVNPTTGERIAGGACDDCPFRVSSKGKTECMNPACYNAKAAAEWAEWQEKETDIAGKRKALSHEECESLYQYGDQLHHTCGKVDLAQRPDSADLRPGLESPGTWRALTKGSEIEISVVRDRNGVTHLLVDRKLAIVAAKLAGHDVFREPHRAEKKPAQTDEQHKSTTLATKSENDLQRATDTAWIDEIIARGRRMRKTPDGFFAIVRAFLTDTVASARAGNETLLHTVRELSRIVGVERKDVEKKIRARIKNAKAEDERRTKEAATTAKGAHVGGAPIKAPSRKAKK